MPFLTSLLLFLTGLALLIAALRSRPKAKQKRLEQWEEYKMELGARICRTAARDAFSVDLDHSFESLAVLNSLLSEDWPKVPSGAVPAEADIAKDTFFVFASYVGDVFHRHYDAEWQLDKEKHAWPYLFFKSADLAASPFDIIEKKLKEPSDFRLDDAARRLVQELERRKHVRATTWHADGENVSFQQPGESFRASITAEHPSIPVNPDEANPEK